MRSEAYMMSVHRRGGACVIIDVRGDKNSSEHAGVTPHG